MNAIIDKSWGFLKGDKMIWLIVFILFIFSMLAVYSATGTLAFKMEVNNSRYLFKQIM
jgi:cell division protein FtsW